MADEQKDEKKLGGQIQLDVSIHEQFKQLRNRYPCTVCTVFNSASCDTCKCGKCEVGEDKCPKCKNMPKTLSQYQVLHGYATPGQNWEAQDYFQCARCQSTWNVKWDLLPSYQRCPRCYITYFCYPFFTWSYKGCVRAARKPGLNTEREDVFKCPSCRQYVNAKHEALPGNQKCQCGRVYYCYRAPEQQSTTDSVVNEGKKAIKNITDAFK